MQKKKEKKERKTTSERGGGLDLGDFWFMVWLQSFISAEDPAVFAARHVRGALHLVPLGTKTKKRGARVSRTERLGIRSFRRHNLSRAQIHI